MAYQRKTKTVYDLITDYGYGEEVECSYDDHNEAREDLFRYKREKKLGYLPELRSVRLHHRREKI